MRSVLEVDADHWETEVLQSEALVVVDFWHENCPWCSRLDPIYSEVSEEYEKVKFAKLNVLSSHENQHLAAKYGVMGTPTLMFFCDGRPVETAVGFQSKDRLKQLIAELVHKHKECIKQSTKLES